jgi:hypothetical protein
VGVKLTMEKVQRTTLRGFFFCHQFVWPWPAVSEKQPGQKFAILQYGSYYINNTSVFENLSSSSFLHF